MKNQSLVSLAIFLLLAGCGSNDDAQNPQTGKSQVLVVNEGNFSQSNGSITAYNTATEEVTENLFESVNNRPLGDVVQSLHVDLEGTGYVVVNSSRKIEVVNSVDFSSLATIEEGLANPRYLLRVGEQLFVSNWGNFDENFRLDQSYVLLLNADTFEEEGRIDTEDGSENLQYSDGYLYVSNSFTNTVSVVEVTTGSLLNTLETAASPGEMVVGADGSVWLICGGNYQANDGAIFRLSPNAAELTAGLEVNPVTRLSINKGANILYYATNSGIGSFDIAEEVLNKNFISMPEAVGFWALGYSDGEDVLYVADAKGFQGKGTVYRYTIDGELLSEFESGVGPNSFVFLNQD